LSGQEKPPAKVSDLNYHLGLWTDGDGRVYVAVAAERLVLCVSADGKTSVAARSPDGWSPSGGMVDRDGNLWLLEYDAKDTARARRIDRDGKDHVYNGESPRR
jgi:hypothetical protein